MTPVERHFLRKLQRRRIYQLELRLRIDLGEMSRLSCKIPQKNVL